MTKATATNFEKVAAELVQKFGVQAPPETTVGYQLILSELRRAYELGQASIQPAQPTNQILVMYDTYNPSSGEWRDDKRYGVFESVEQAIAEITARYEKRVGKLHGGAYDFYYYPAPTGERIDWQSCTALLSINDEGMTVEVEEVKK